MKKRSFGVVAAIERSSASASPLQQQQQQQQQRFSASRLERSSSNKMQHQQQQTHLGPCGVLDIQRKKSLDFRDSRKMHDAQDFISQI